MKGVFCAAAVLVCGGLMGVQAKAQNAGDQFRHLADEYFTQVTFKFGPTYGTLAGLHQYDRQLEDFSRAGVEREVAALKEYEAKFDAVDGSKLDGAHRATWRWCAITFAATFWSWRRFGHGRRIRTFIRAGSPGARFR